VRRPRKRKISVKFCLARQGPVRIVRAVWRGMSTVTATALSGMNAATLRFSAAAGDIASGKSDDMAKDIVELLAANRDFEANLLVLRIDSDMSDRLLDIVA
jgi:hypothetical protein